MLIWTGRSTAAINSIPKLNRLAAPRHNQGANNARMSMTLFDNIDHALLLRAVRKHVTCKWALLYIERWLTAPMEQNDGTVVERKRGTPQGDVVNPPSAGGSPQKQAPSALRLATGIKCLAERWLRICPASCMSARPGDACPGRRCGTGQMVKSAGRRSRPAYARNSGIPIKVRVRLSLF
jgi:hypothetical protein